uniref:Uncharacterized protein n=1 Tax=Rhizophora mucronata TaxID=61149 RepID=A0A2P2PTW5_RHIMU
MFTNNPDNKDSPLPSNLNGLNHIWDNSFASFDCHH